MSETSIHDTSVQALIDRIRDQGVQSAKQEAARIAAEAEAKAAKLLADAQKQVEQLPRPKPKPPNCSRTRKNKSNNCASKPQPR
jgi:hypothetical protein